MAPTLLTVGTAFLACAGNAAAKKWYLDDTYDATNFFDKFNFFESKFDTGELNDIDPTGGHVNYQSRENAFSKGLVGYRDGEVYMGADHKTVLPGAFQPGRPSVRIESKARYNHGLLIARFSHLPANKCGVWPAMWTYGNDWPNDGEVDIYEEWNNSPWNQPALHTNNSPKYGQCILDGADQSSSVLTDNCDNSFSNPPIQWNNQGCVSAETKGPWASKDGGVYAMEWTSDYIKLFNWAWADVPANVDSKTPDTATWGTPSVFVKNKHCNIDNHFSNQKLVLNINFCGIPPALPEIWGQSCAAETKVGDCVKYVSEHPGDFDEVYFQIKDIRYFVGTAPPATSSSSSSSTSSTSSTTSASSATSSSTTLATTTSSAVSSSAASSSTESTSEAVSTSSSAESSSATSEEPVVSTTSSTLVTSTTSWSNSSVPITTASPSSTSTGEEMTTSTVYTTTVYTVTDCPPWVNCPAGGYVTTKTIPLYTTVCPVTAHPTPTSTDDDDDAETITATVTTVSTITSCPPSVTDCPIGKVITKVITTTYCPGAEETEVPAVPTYPNGPETVTTTSVYTISSCPPSVTDCPIGSVTTDVITTTVAPHPSGSYNNGTIPTKPSPVPSSGSESGCTGPNCPAKGSASKMGASVMVVLVGAIAAMML